MSGASGNNVKYSSTNAKEFAHEHFAVNNEINGVNDIYADGQTLPQEDMRGAMNTGIIGYTTKLNLPCCRTSPLVWFIISLLSLLNSSLFL